LSVETNKISKKESSRLIRISQAMSQSQYKSKRSTKGLQQRRSDDAHDLASFKEPELRSKQIIETLAERTRGRQYSPTERIRDMASTANASAIRVSRAAISRFRSESIQVRLEFIAGSHSEAPSRLADSGTDTNPLTGASAVADSECDNNPLTGASAVADSWTDTTPLTGASAVADSGTDTNPLTGASAVADSETDINPRSGPIAVAGIRTDTNPLIGADAVTDIFRKLEVVTKL
jgi:hypothetical protein